MKPPHYQCSRAFPIISKIREVPIYFLLMIRAPDHRSFLCSELFELKVKDLITRGKIYKIRCSSNFSSSDLVKKCPSAPGDTLPYDIRSARLPGVNIFSSSHITFSKN